MWKSSFILYVDTPEETKSNIASVDTSHPSTGLARILNTVMSYRVVHNKEDSHERLLVKVGMLPPPQHCIATTRVASNTGVRLYYLR